MNRFPAHVVLSILGLLIASASPARGQTREATVVDTAGQVLSEVMALPARGIPESLLADAQGIAIIPDLLKGAFIIGVRHGRGVVVVRDEAGAWKPPVFISLTGGGVGYQIGLQATDVVLVFKTRSSVRGLLSGKFTLGADAAVAAGPVGRQAAAATDIALRAEIYSYSRSRGLFAGVSLDGSVLQIDAMSNAIYYTGTGVPAAVAVPPQPGQLPPSATRLLDLVGRYTAPPTAGMPAMTPVPVAAPIAPTGGGGSAEVEMRRQLADSARRLQALLDEQWRSYLSLPAEVYAGDRPPSTAAIGQSLARFDTTLAEPRYQSLTRRAEFRATYDSLKRYSGLQASRTSPTLALPPPPR